MAFTKSNFIEAAYVFMMFSLLENYLKKKKKKPREGGHLFELRYTHHFSTTHRDVLQVEVLVVHGLTQLPDFLLDLFHLLCSELILVGRVVLVQLQQLDHKLQAGSVQIHVKTISTQNVHQGSRAQSEVLIE